MALNLSSLPTSLLLTLGSLPPLTPRIPYPNMVGPLVSLVVRHLLGKAMPMLSLVLIVVFIRFLLKLGTNRLEFSIRVRPLFPLFLKVILLIKFLQLKAMALFTLVVWLLMSITWLPCLRRWASLVATLLLAIPMVPPAVPRFPQFPIPVLGPMATMVPNIRFLLFIDLILRLTPLLIHLQLDLPTVLLRVAGQTLPTVALQNMLALHTPLTTVWGVPFPWKLGIATPPMLPPQVVAIVLVKAVVLILIISLIWSPLSPPVDPRSTLKPSSTPAIKMYRVTPQYK